METAGAPGVVGAAYRLRMPHTVRTSAPPQRQPHRAHGVAVSHPQCHPRPPPPPLSLLRCPVGAVGLVSTLHGPRCSPWQLRGRHPHPSGLLWWAMVVVVVVVAVVQAAPMEPAAVLRPPTR